MRSDWECRGASAGGLPGRPGGLGDQKALVGEHMVGPQQSLGTGHPFWSPLFPSTECVRVSVRQQICRHAAAAQGHTPQGRAGTVSPQCLASLFCLIIVALKSNILRILQA